MAFTGHEEQQITFEEGGEMTANYRETISGEGTIAQYFSKDSINALLSQTGCVGIRVYYGISKDGQSQLILVGVDTNEDDIIGNDKVCIDRGIKDPPNSSAPNILNS
jgi:hypothetical protein